jgi:hypothetical protein
MDTVMKLRFLSGRKFLEKLIDYQLLKEFSIVIPFHSQGGFCFVELGGAMKACM